MLTIPTWYVPSFYGDIQLMATGETTCDVITTELTADEARAIVKLQAAAHRKGWIAKAASLATSGTTALRGPIDQVATLLAKTLKPKRAIISAVRFKDGTMQEICDVPSTAAPTTTSEPYLDPAPVVATSVAAPVRGCPAPDFSSAEIRAQRVLAAFLTTDQLEDFKKHQKFISIGATTGNRYMVTSRHARDQLAKYHRSLYDLDRDRAICTHDWDVPAAEELLALHLLLQLPGWETYLNEVTEDNVEEVLREQVGDGAAEELLASDTTAIRLGGGMRIIKRRGAPDPV